MKVNAFAIIPHVKNKAVEVELEIMPLVLCKDCIHGRHCGDGIDCDGVWHDNDWFCANGEEKEGVCNE